MRYERMRDEMLDVMISRRKVCTCIDTIVSTP